MNSLALPLPIVRTVSALRERMEPWRAAGERIGLVPTMGALHEGHLSLTRLLRARGCDRVVATIFVNPAQFAPHEDLARYPRDEAGDAALLTAAGVDLLFAPTTQEMYPPAFSTKVTIEGVSAPLEGEARPHFFGGVATVVAKLLIQAAPDEAAFGEKDYQQLQVIRRMAIDLDLPVIIVPAPTVREADGLAMSSRNKYLSPQARMQAAALPKVLEACVAAARGGADLADAAAAGQAELEAAGFAPVDYLTFRDADTLGPPQPGRPMRLFAAAWLGPVRLIDNFAV
ncbi:MAG: pantoate--beta-alanine ligase [Alphaproteobacteria bacterium]|nr:pantoate--beta-alanine ligase [Alphaproteobacteria bacterium]